MSFIGWQYGWKYPAQDASHFVELIKLNKLQAHVDHDYTSQHGHFYNAQVVDPFKVTFRSSLQFGHTFTVCFAFNFWKVQIRHLLCNVFNSNRHEC